jgi:hypothetical protein
LEKEWGKSFRVCHCPAASKRLTAQDQTNRNASAATANSFMLDFRCVIIPRFAFATSHAFHAERIRDKKITQRIKQVADELVRFTKALRS